MGCGLLLSVDAAETGMLRGQQLESARRRCACTYRVNSRHVHTGEEAEPFLFHEIRVLHIHQSSSYIHRPQRLGP